MKLGLLKQSFPNSPSGGSFAAGAAYAPSSPGSYGGPAGSFIMSPVRNRVASCPAGYQEVAMSRGDKRCIPIPRRAPMPAAPAPIIPNITVSPNFQQSFTPQFSPTLQQQQDSPGASQAASPVQAAAPTQSAPTPAATPAPAPAPAPVASPIPAPVNPPIPQPPVSLPPTPGTTPGPTAIPVGLPATIGPRMTGDEMARETGPTYDIQAGNDKMNWLPLLAIGGIALLALSNPEKGATQ